MQSKDKQHGTTQHEKEAEGSGKRVAVNDASLPALSPIPTLIERDGIVLWANAALARLLRVSSAPEIAGRSVFHLIHPGSLAAFQELLERLREQEEQPPLPGRQLVRADGSPADVDIMAWKAAYEGAPAVFLSFVDIGRLLESEERFRKLSESTVEGVLIHDGRQVLMANAAAAGIFGYQPDELTGRSLQEMIAPESRALAFQRMNEGFEEPYEASCLRKGGTVFPVEVRGRQIEFQGQRRRVTVVRDITERKHAEAEREALLRTVEAERVRLAAIIEQMPSGVVLAEAPSGRILLHNREAERLLGHPLLAARGPADYSRYGTRHLDGTPYAPEEHPLARALQGEQVANEEALYVMGETPPAYLSINAAPIRDASGRIVFAVTTFVDIGDRKRIEKALLESEAHARKVLNSLAAFVGVMTPDGTLIQANRRALEAGGLEPGDVLGKPFWETWWWSYSPGVQARLREAVERAVRGEASRYDVDVRMAGGRMITVDFQIVPMRDEDGRITHLVPSGLDITERKRAEEALRDSERRYSALFANKIYGIAHLHIITDERGKPVDYLTIEVNEAYERIIGVKKSDVEGKRVTEAFPGIENFHFDFVGAYGRVALEGGEEMFEVHLNFTNQWLSVYAYSPKHMECVAIFTDITGRKHAEEALRESEERFRTLADNIAQFAWMADSDGSLFWYNHRWYEYTGATFEEMQGWGWQKVHHPDHVNRVVASFRASVQTGEPWEDTFPLRGRNGEWRWFLSRALPVRDSEGRLVRWFGTNTDITEQLKTEGQLRRSNEALRQFAYAAAHDLQEPLRNVALSLQLLQRRYRERFDAAAETLLMAAVEGARRMHQMVKDLLTYTRVTEEAAKPSAPQDPNHALALALENLQAALEESQAEIVRQELPAVSVHASNLVRLFQNLIGNAIKYRKPGEPLKIEIAAAGRESEWVFSVADNGIGFDPVYAERIFGIFKRLHQQSQYRGTGIGLAICARIVEDYGGRIWAESEPGKGSTFYFTFPKTSKSE